MTTVAVLVDPPAETTPLGACVEAGALTAAEAETLYAAMARDVCRAVEASGGELLVNYAPADDRDPTATDPDEDAKAAVRDALAEGLSDPESTRFEVQVGSTLSARVGNTVTHLLEREGIRTAAVVEPAAVMLERRHVDSAAMKLRGAEVVLAPAPDGRVAYAAFREPVDFTDAFAEPSLRTLTDRARDEGSDVDFLERLPVVEESRDLGALVAELQARRRADAWVPPGTTAVVEELGLGVESGGDGLQVVRD